MKLICHILSISTALKYAFEARLQLLAAEVEEEKMRIVRLLWLSVLGAGAFFTCLIVLFGLSLELVANHQRTNVYVITIILLLTLGVVCMILTKRLLNESSKPFSRTRRALKRDKESLKNLARSLDD